MYPVPSATTVPALELPSPHVIVAAKSAAVASASVEEKPATVASNKSPSVALKVSPR